MPKYQYTAISGDGKKIKGAISAENAYAARKQLRMRGIHATGVKEIRYDEEKRTLLSIFKRSNKNQLINFTKEMSTLLNSGIKLTEAIGVLAAQVSDAKFKSALNDIRDRVIAGESFTDTLKDYGDYFDIIYISMIRVGEVTGNLGDVFSTLANFMDKRQKVEKKIITSMIYPIILIIFCIGVVLFLTATVIPQVANQLIRSGKELPTITKVFMSISNTVTSWWVFLVAAVLIGIVWGIKRLLKTDKGAYIRDKLVLKLPLFGSLIRQRVVARFASTLSTLLGAGLSMADSLKVVSEVTGNRLMTDAINRARERIMAGSDIAAPLRESGVIDPTIAHMVSVGEKSGELEFMLRNISNSLEEQTDTMVERLSVAIEPLVIVFMTFMVGLIAYATILPILELSSGNF